MLAWTVYISFFGVLVLLLLPEGNAKTARGVALLSVVIGLVIALGGALRYEAKAGIETVVDKPWIPGLGIHYYLAVDGISLTLLLLTGVAAVVGILFSWNIE